MAHPRPLGVAYGMSDVTVVIPVRDCPGPLGRLLSSLGSDSEVIVVDDGSADGRAIESIAEAAGARLFRHEISRGPAAARNTGLCAVRTRLIAFVDSDCVVTPNWLVPLLRHFDDPAVGLVAPRIVSLHRPQRQSDWLAAYDWASASHDRGPSEALVTDGGKVSWVSGSALVARTDELGGGFDEVLLSGEDVDLVWRMMDEGWRVRYEPRSEVAHEHRRTLRSWTSRKVVYGSSAGRLTCHGHRIAPIVLPPWAAAFWGLIAIKRKTAKCAALLVAGSAPIVLAKRLRGIDKRWQIACELIVRGSHSSGRQIASAMVRHWWPMSLLVATISRRMRRMLFLCAISDGLIAWTQDRPEMDFFRFLLIRRLDDLAYGWGLWKGAWREKTLTPLVPVVAHGTKATTPVRAGGHLFHIESASRQR